MRNFQKLIEEYSPEYCLFLETTYSKGMMSEGGMDAVDAMFQSIDLHKKSMLDIGFGLGGIEFYLAEKYQAKVTGIEINSWMVEEATRRTPEHLKSFVKFLAYKNPPTLPFSDSKFNIVFSKGVLTHVKDKLPLFEEAYRVLKPGGLFIINDWLSPTQGKWGKRLQKMCDIEDLTLYAETKSDYKIHLEKSGFLEIIMRAENKNYSKYNQEIVNHLKSKKYADAFIKQFGEKQWKDAIEGYQLIIDSIDDNELLVTWMQCKK